MRAFPRPASFLVVALLAALAGCAPERPVAKAPPRRTPTVREEIRAWIAREDSTTHAAPDTTDAERRWAALVAFYAERKGKPAWSDGKRLRPEADTLVAQVAGAMRWGLDPRDYDAPQLTPLHARLRETPAPGDTTVPAAFAQFDVRATAAVLRLAADLGHGLTPARVLDPDWTRGRDTTVTPAVLEAIGRHHALGHVVALEPRHLGYRRLRAALERMLADAAAGGWPQVPAGPKLERGARGPRVAALVRRLVATGDLRGAVTDTVVDARVMRAIGDFQSRHGIPRSGVVGEVTRTALNVPVATRIRQVALNLERWRWLPAELGGRHLTVNLPAYRVDLMRGDTLEVALRAVVGKRRSPTPVFTDAIAYIDLNPTWSVPKSILTAEVLPAMRKDPEYLAKHRMRVVSWGGDRAASLDPATIPWKDAAADTFRWFVIADAGPENPLGRIKFMCPNEYDVYLHDSPQRERFGVSSRDFSHGCVRVAEPEALADSLLGPLPGDTANVAGLLADGQWRRLRLARPIPVHFLYWTAWVDDSARVQFRDDLYGLDARLDSALVARNWDTFQLNPGVSLSPLWMEAQAREEARKAELQAKKAADAAKRARAKRTPARGSGTR